MVLGVASWYCIIIDVLVNPLQINLTKCLFYLQRVEHNENTHYPNMQTCAQFVFCSSTKETAPLVYQSSA